MKRVSNNKILKIGKFVCICCSGGTPDLTYVDSTKPVRTWITTEGVRDLGIFMDLNNSRLDIVERLVDGK